MNRMCWETKAKSTILSEPAWNSFSLIRSLKRSLILETWWPAVCFKARSRKRMMSSRWSLEVISPQTSKKPTVDSCWSLFAFVDVAIWSMSNTSERDEDWCSSCNEYDDEIDVNVSGQKRINEEWKTFLLLLLLFLVYSPNSSRPLMDKTQAVVRWNWTRSRDNRVHPQLTTKSRSASRKSWGKTRREWLSIRNDDKNNLSAVDSCSSFYTRVLLYK